MGCKGFKRKLVGFLRFKKAHDCTLLSLPRYHGSLIRLVQLLFSWPAERPVQLADSLEPSGGGRAVPGETLAAVVFWLVRWGDDYGGPICQDSLRPKIR